MILRIDDIISAGAPKGGALPPGGGSYGACQNTRRLISGF